MSDAPRPASVSPVVGVLWMVATTFCFVMVNVLVKWIGDSLPIFQSAFLRFALGIVFLLPMMPHLRGLAMPLRLWRLSVARAGLHAVAMTCWFYAMTRIPMAEVTAMNFMNPVYVTLGAVIFLGEKIAWPRISAMGVAMIGALVVLRPGFRELDPGHLAMILTALAFGGSYLLASRLVQQIPPSAVVLLMSVMVPVLLAPFAFADWMRPSLAQLGLLLLTAFFATAGHYAMTRAFAAAPQSVIQPVTMVQLVWSVALGWVLFGEPVDPFVILGGAMIMIAVTFITLREARKKRAWTDAV